MIGAVSLFSNISVEGNIVGLSPTRLFTFVKKYNSTTLKIVWTDVFRCHGPANAGCRWELRFNQGACTSPQKGIMQTIVTSQLNLQITRADTITGYCNATDVPMLAGSYELQVFASIPTAGVGIPNIGYASHPFTFEVSEVFI